MCNVLLSYRDGDISKIKEHLRFEHRVSRDGSYVLAGYFMTEEERVAVKNVVAIKAHISFEVEENFDVLAFHPTGKVLITPMVPKEPQNLNLKISSNTVTNKPFRKSGPGPKSEDELTRETVPGLRQLKPRSKEELNIAKNETGRNGPWKDRGSVIVGPLELPGPGRQCRICGKEYVDGRKMVFHFKNVHQRGEFPCKECGKVFPSYSNMTCHYSRYCKKDAFGETRRKIGEFSCKDCGTLSKTSSGLKEHRRRRCKARTTPKNEESERMNKVEEVEVDDPDVKSSNTSLKTNFLDIERSPLPCKACGSKFNTVRELRIHYGRCILAATKSQNINKSHRTWSTHNKSLKETKTKIEVKGEEDDPVKLVNIHFKNPSFDAENKPLSENETTSEVPCPLSETRKSSNAENDLINDDATIEEIDPLTESEPWSLNECDNAFKTSTENEVFSEAVTEDENDSDPLLSDSSLENEIDPLLSTSDLDNGVMMVDNVGDIVS